MIYSGQNGKGCRIDIQRYFTKPFQGKLKCSNDQDLYGFGSLACQFKPYGNKMIKGKVP